MKLPSRAWVAVGLAAGVACTGTPAATDHAAERTRIAAERATVEQAAARDEAQCAQRFEVTACVDKVRAQRRQQLDALRRQQILIDDERRRQRAAERTRALERRRIEMESRESEPPLATPPAPAADAAASAARPKARPRTSRRLAGDAVRHHAERYEARQREIAAHREAVARRNAERAASGKGAAGLPIPADAAASGPR